MMNSHSDQDRNRMKAELGAQAWNAIGHFLSYGDFLAYNEGNYRDAVAEYRKAWEQLNATWQQQLGGHEILEGIADFALLSEDADFASETLNWLLPRARPIIDASLTTVCDKLARLADQRKMSS